MALLARTARGSDGRVVRLLDSDSVPEASGSRWSAYGGSSWSGVAFFGKHCRDTWESIRASSFDYGNYGKPQRAGGLAFNLTHSDSGHSSA